MKRILITGAKGFLGKNLVARLSVREDVEIFEYDLGNSADELREWTASADVVFHLAGVNRPETDVEFEEGNAGFTKTLVDAIRDAGQKPLVVVSSTIHAELDNPYGRSKQHGEKILTQFAEDTGTPVSIFRLKNLFGKWSRANYNSVTATFCYNIANDLPIQINDPNYTLDLSYVDDVVETFIAEMDDRPNRKNVLIDPNEILSHEIKLGELAGQIQFFRDMQESLQIPDFSIPFNRKLYATYLSHLPKDRWEYGPTIHADDRGNLAELVKSPHFGQIFVSRTKPGITRGNHYHHTKTEKFIVIGGEGVIRFRHINGTEIFEYPVKGEEYRIVEIPPGYTHSISNTGDTTMITLFWVSEQFNPDHPDTYYLSVDIESDD